MLAFNTTQNFMIYDNYLKYNKIDDNDKKATLPDPLGPTFFTTTM
jgi:hypothetical protein